VKFILNLSKKKAPSIRGLIDLLFRHQKQTRCSGTTFQKIISTLEGGFFKRILPIKGQRWTSRNVK
jgi:hypothetical protein